MGPGVERQVGSGPLTFRVAACRHGARTWLDAPEGDDRVLVDLEHQLVAVADASGPTYGGYHRPTGVDAGLVALVASVARGAKLEAALAAANAAMYVAPPWPPRTHPTASITALHLVDHRATIAHVGSGRAYRSCGGVLEHLVREHTVSAAADCPEPAAPFYRRIVTRLLGFQPDVAVDSAGVLVHPADVFLLCTDGIWAHVDDDALSTVLASGAPVDDLATAVLDLSARREDAGVVVVRVE